ncbi:MAG TPA: DUF1573 domain-containing protein [Spirochaetota bacterium]|nr:DUF1573 domain-containing protein [Spirochaetota bacterium]HQO40768.1 DUF1573 domain-containing protein [Spirochaetota bacterium]
MKKIFLAITILAAVSLYARSGIKFDRVAHDFGSVQPDTVVTAAFSFKNTGSSVLVIERVRTACGCTNTMLTRKELKPGEQGLLEIAFDSAGYSGRVTRTVTVYTNDPDNREIRLKITANVMEPAGQ